VLHHVVAEAVEAGCSEIVMVISKGKEAICRYFAEDAELDAQLAASGKSHLLDDLRRLQGAARFHYVYQEEMRGLGDAVLCGAHAVGNEPFAVLLGDTVIAGESPLAAMTGRMREQGLSSVAVQPVAAERAVRYGVAGGRETAAGEFSLEAMVEKPAADAIPRMKMLDGRIVHMAFAARYVFSPAIVDCLRHTPPGRNGEVQLTDAMAQLLAEEGFAAQLLRGQRLDIGHPEGLFEALQLWNKK
jgi:UTP--glucose-1-phosphate uridylyltransferase